MRSKAVLLSAIALGAIVFVGAFLAYPMVVRPASGAKEGIPIGGYYVIEAYHSDGTVFATWQGHNSLSPFAITGIAECMSGQGLQYPELGTCQGPTLTVEVDNGGNGVFTGAANSTLYPSGCNYSTNPPTCTGWQTKGTITFSSGTFPVTLIHAGTETIIQTTFDSVNITPITVNKGDAMSVTVTFTVS